MRELIVDEIWIRQMMEEIAIAELSCNQDVIFAQTVANRPVRMKKPIKRLQAGVKR
jgi:hypothetical protein